MKTKQAKEELDKSLDEDTVAEPKTRARKKASDCNEEEKKPVQDDPKTSKESKKPGPKPKAVVKKRPLGIRKTKTLRGKKVPPLKKNVIKKTITRARKTVKEAFNSRDKETVPLIPAAEIKKEPLEDPTPGSRSSSPRTAGRRVRLSSDMVMMKSVLGDSPTTLVLGPRTSPYSMRSERSNSPSLFDGKNLRSGKPRKVKSNLLNEVVMKEQKKRRLLSDSKTADAPETSEDTKKLKRGRSSSRDGSEISKCSDITESDVSLSEPLNDNENKELSKNLDKTKTDLDLDIENNVQISPIGKVPSLSVDSKLTETKPYTEPSSMLKEKNKKKLSLKRSTSLDSDNNNSNRIKLENINVSDLEDKYLLKTENDALIEERSSILTSMSKTFNSKEVSKNIRKARRGKKAATTSRPIANQGTKNGINSTITNDLVEDKHETVDSLSKEISDLINDLDQNIDRDQEMSNDTNVDQLQTKSARQFYGISKPLGDNNSIIAPDTPVKDKDTISAVVNECTPSKNDDSENIRLHYEDSVEKCPENRPELYKCNPTVASIDKLMDRLKEFEEFDKRRQRQESECKTMDNKSVMVSDDVVLIPKSGAEYKHLKDLQPVRSPERVIEKENVLSCFENNSAISIVKRDQVRRSIDIDLPNSVTLIKRNSVSARKESTSSNHSKDSDAISIFEKSLGKDVTLTEIRKSVEKSAPAQQIDLHQFATLHPNNASPAFSVIDTSQISITSRTIESKINSNEVKITKRKSSGSLSRKSSESGVDVEEKSTLGDKMMSPPHQIKSPPHQMKSPTHQIKSQAISITPTPVAIKSPESTHPIEADPVTPPLEEVKTVPNDIPLTSEVPKIDSITDSTKIEPAVIEQTKIEPKKKESTKIEPTKMETAKIEPAKIEPTKIEPTKMEPPKKEQKIELTQIEPAKIVPPIIEPPTIEIPASEPEKIESTKIAPKNIEPEPTIKTDQSIVEEVTNVTKEVPEKTIEPELKLDKIEQPMETETELVDYKIEEVNITNDIKEVKDANEIKESKGIKHTKEIKEVEDKKEKEDIRPKGPKVKSARNSTENQPGPSNVLLETPESQKRKENVLRTLGLLTHKAANEAKIEKMKEKERIYGPNYSGGMGKPKAGKSDYTGTLKTVIKLSRGAGDRDKKKFRSSLKMTFQKTKSRSGKPPQEFGEAGSEDDAYYTIERREGGAPAIPDGGHRKSHYSNRLNNHEAEAVPEPEPKEILNLVIPEKASSFSIHPGRLCMDQCFYCGGKFGLFDTPCHIAQMKSGERQRKVLDNEEKLTIDSCLCDACYRHVDRRANCPSYRKRPVAKPPDVPLIQMSEPVQPIVPDAETVISPPLEEESEEETPAATAGRLATCHTSGCATLADHSIRRKWLIKMRSNVNKILKLECDYPGLHTIPLCAEHYRSLTPLMACVLCRCRLTKHHNLHFIHHGYTDLNPLLKEAGIPVEFHERPVLCKVCRYFCTLLQRPGHKDKHARAYTRKLLQIYNIEIPPELNQDADDSKDLEDCNTSANKQKKKARTKSKQRKSTEPEKQESYSESSERTTESSPEKEKPREDVFEEPKPPQSLEEDIESLISSNKIPVPGAKPSETNPPSDASETETVPDMVTDLDSSLVPIDKQTELRYLLQKQNNPAQFQHNTNLTQKQKNILKMHNLGIQKPGQLQRISDKNSKRVQKLGHIFVHKDKPPKKDVQDIEMFDTEKAKEMSVFKNITLNDECTIETIPNKRPADINLLKNKWQMSESFTQVKRNLSELSKKTTGEKEPKKHSEAKYSNPVKRLETNPSISVRELFPGEEEMNLQCNIEFNNIKGVTPEGWEKCNTMIQYDVETKKLWNELQRPYGNQSSFLRHLILLEKYFRNGDLVLSHNASPHAANYSTSVQSRLRAYDNVPSEPRRESVSLIEFRKKPSLNGKSLLKSNQNSEEKDHKKFMPPPLPKPKPKSDKKNKPLPPELIAINTPNAQGRKAIQNVLHNIQQLVKGVSASDPTEVAAAPLPPPTFEPPREKKEMPGLIKDKKEKSESVKEKKEHKADTPKKQKANNKGWRPTLMPITPENLARVARETPKVAVDGHSLPSLVQVLSAGTRYHITFEDYNRMCLIRRERQKRLQEKEAKTRMPSSDETIVTELQPSTLLGNGGTVLQNITSDREGDKKNMPELQIGANAATILKNVGLKNITIAPIPSKTATVTSQTFTPSVSSPLLVTTPMKIPQLGPSVSITSETILTPSICMTPSQMILPKIPKSLTVIPQTVSNQMIIPFASSASQIVASTSQIVATSVSQSFTDQRP
ncbi:uncharacterized protein LOC120631549 isoform X1 [Pararge aegeria]|uniref:uncharacterized protein LOC120631549 isoform X1 n=1 Tax=Pararge aegeria TaxID=116150 RepID=UPI0019CFB0A4|nr:uncharacterized protein LOC120631549 isoform X1 [Pararge aegeria]XP_039757113.1 uncharacterized protein LOC120631549 isoform X1 [Pararge aegeria]